MTTEQKFRATFFFVVLFETCLADFPDWQKINLEEFPHVGRVYSIRMKDQQRMAGFDCNAVLVSLQAALTASKCVSNNPKAEQSFMCFGEKTKECKRVAQTELSDDDKFKVAYITADSPFIEGKYIKPGIYNVYADFGEALKLPCRDISIDFETTNYDVLSKSLRNRWTHRSKGQLYDQFQFIQPKLICPEQLGSPLVCNNVIYGIRTASDCYIGHRYAPLTTLAE